MRWAVSCSPGHVWQAIRENERRVEVIGLRPFGFKLLAFVLASFLATMRRVIWLLVLGTARRPQVTTANFTLTLLVMVVIGGAGTRYGALLGGFLYTLADQRLGALAGSSTMMIYRPCCRRRSPSPSSSSATLFILLVFFVPGGLASLGHRAAAAARPARGTDEDRLGAPRRGAAAAADPRARLRALGLGARGRAARRAPSTSILFDNRGVGESDAPPGPYTAAEMAADAVQVLDEAGVERAHVVGTSLGGMIAQELALGHPERVDRLVLACTTPGGPQAFPMPQRTVELMQARATLREFTENALEPDPRRELVDRILVHRERTAQAFEAWAAQAAAGATFDAHDRLGSLAAPTLVQHGDGDLSSIPATPTCSPRRFRTRASRLSPAAAISSCGRSPRGSSASWRSSCADDSDRWISDRARTTPGRVAIDFRDGQTTYGELDERSDRLAAGLLEAGLVPGDRVATLTGTSPEHVVVFFACAKAGLILMPLNTRLAGPELALPARRRRAGRPPLLRRARRDGAPRSTRERPGSRSLCFRNTSRSPAPADDDGLLLVYTSGTTGKPKGALLTHANCFWTNLSFDRVAGRVRRGHRAAGAAAVPRRRLERAAAARLVEGRDRRARAGLRSRARARS